MVITETFFWERALFRPPTFAKTVPECSTCLGMPAGMGREVSYIFLLCVSAGLRVPTLDSEQEKDAVQAAKARPDYLSCMLNHLAQVCIAACLKTPAVGRLAISHCS